MDAKSSQMGKGAFTSSLTDPAEAALHLFERTPPKEYIEEWTQSLMKPTLEELLGDLSILIFRIENEWLALPTAFLKEVIHRRKIHRIPYRSNSTFLGIVNVNGELQLVASLNQLLGIEPLPGTLPPAFPYERDRMLAIVKEGDQWVFPVDEIEGVSAWNSSLLEQLPLNPSTALNNHLKGVMKTQAKRIGLLDAELLFSSLERSIR